VFHYMTTHKLKCRNEGGWLHVRSSNEYVHVIPGQSASCG
jgi:hypothetical protein